MVDIVTLWDEHRRRRLRFFACPAQLDDNSLIPTKESHVSLDENKRTSARYFNYDVAEMDEILTPDFIGRHPKNAHTWNLEQHKAYWTDRSATATVHQQVAEGNWVAVKVTNGEFEVMQFQRFENGKIAELWETYSR